MIDDPETLKRERRDRLVTRCFLWLLLPFTAAYFVADGMGFLPAAVSVRIRSERKSRADLFVKGDDSDPDTVLGIAIGDTRFRLNYTNAHAIVTRPLHGVEEWVIPSHFTYQGITFTVTALDSFALLHATQAHTISLPPTLLHLNDAPSLANDVLKHLYLRRPNGEITHYTYPRSENAPPIE